MSSNGAARDEVASTLTKDGWRISQELCAVPFPLLDGFRDEVASAFIAEKGPYRVTFVVKPVANDEEYPRIIREIVEHHAQFPLSVGDIETEVIIDEVRGHFELTRSGWANGHRVHGIVIHIDIRGDKILIQHDGTEDGIANQLVIAGVPKDKIVLAFQSPETRKYTDFAVA